MEGQVAGAVSEKRPDPLDQVRADPFSGDEREEWGRLHVVKTPLDIKEESGDLVAETVERFNIVL